MPVYNNELKDDPLVFAEQKDFSGGQNSAGKPADLAPNECQLIQNGDILRNGKLRKRVGHSSLGALSAGNPVQGMGYMSTATIQQLLMACNGAMFSYNGSAIVVPVPNV